MNLTFIITSFLIVVAQPILAQKVVFDYHFNGHTKDSSSNKNHLIDFGSGSSYSYTKGAKVNDSAITFKDGIGLISSNPLVNTNWSGATLVAWIKGQGEGNVAVGSFTGFSMSMNTDGTYDAYFDGSSTGQLTSFSKINDNKWHRVVAKTNGDTTYFFVDGVFDSKLAEKQSKLTAPNSEAKLYVGTTKFETYKLFGFDLDRLTLYDVFLSESEIDSLSEVSYNTGISDAGTEIEQLKIYPNPALNYLQLHSVTNWNDILVLNKLGQLVTTKIKFNNHDNNVIADISELPAGVYTIIVNENTSRFIKLNQ